MGPAAAPPGDRLRVHRSRVGQAQSGAGGVRQVAGSDRRAAAGVDGLGIDAHRDSWRFGDPGRGVRRGRERSADCHDARGDVHGPSALRLQRHQHHRVDSRRPAVRPTRIRGQSSVYRRPARADSGRRRSFVDRWVAPTQMAPVPTPGDPMIQTTKVAHRTVRVRDLDIFYREAGPKDAPAVLLLHGFPTSSQMFRNLIPPLADRYRVLAPDYPGFGHSSMPPRHEFAYSFDNLAAVVEGFTAMLGLSKYALYVQDYGSPVGDRLAGRH